MTSPRDLKKATNTIFSDYLPSLDDGSEIDSGWFDVSTVSWLEFQGRASAAGLDLVIESRVGQSQPSKSTTTTYTAGDMFIANIPVRGREMRVRWQNNTGGALTEASALVRQSDGAAGALTYAPIPLSPSTGAVGGVQDVNIWGDASVTNTTTTPLASAATFTGAGELNFHPQIGVQVKTDNSGTLFLDFSADNVNWDSTYPVNGFHVNANIPNFHTAVKLGRYARVRFINDVGAQTYLRLYTYYGSDFIPSVAPANQSLSLESDSISVRPTDFQDEVRIGRRGGITGWNKFALRTGLTAAGGDEIVWGSSSTFTPMLTGDTFDITYNNATDGTGGGATGATQLTVYYIDDDGIPAISAHDLGATGTDTTAFSGLGINRVAVSASGTAEENVNDISFADTGGATLQAIIPASFSVTQQAIFFVGSNHAAVARYLWVNILRLTGGGGDPRVVVKGFVYSRAVQTSYLVVRMSIDTGVQNTIEITDPIGFPLNPTDILYFTADSDTNAADIDLRFSLNEYQNV